MNGTDLAMWRREHNRMSQTELAKRLGVSRNTVNNWEADRFKPPGDLYAQLCAFGGATATPATPQVITPETTPHLYRKAGKKHERAPEHPQSLLPGLTRDAGDPPLPYSMLQSEVYLNALAAYRGKPVEPRFSDTFCPKDECK